MRLCIKDSLCEEHQKNYRIVFSKAPTHDIKGKDFRKFKEKYGSRLDYGSRVKEEYI